MKTSELVKILNHNGCTLHRHVSSHDIWESPLTGKRFSVPRHPSNDIPTGTVNKILKVAGLK